MNAPLKLTRVKCSQCGKRVSVRANGRLHAHTNPNRKYPFYPYSPMPCYGRPMPPITPNPDLITSRLPWADSDTELAEF